MASQQRPKPEASRQPWSTPTLERLDVSETLSGFSGRVENNQGGGQPNRAPS